MVVLPDFQWVEGSVGERPGQGRPTDAARVSAATE